MFILKKANNKNMIPSFSRLAGTFRPRSPSFTSAPWKIFKEKFQRHGSKKIIHFNSLVQTGDIKQIERIQLDEKDCQNFSSIEAPFRWACMNKKDDIIVYLYHRYGSSDDKKLALICNLNRCYQDIPASLLTRLFD